MSDEINVNDGGGLLDNIGLIDSLIVSCNELPNAIFNGQNVRFCALIVEMVQKLSLLKQGVKNDLESLRKQVDELTEILTHEKGAETNGRPAADHERRDND